MEKYILVLVIAEQVTALGPFTSEQSCWGLSKLISKYPAYSDKTYIIACPTETLFKKLYPNLKIQETS